MSRWRRRSVGILAVVGGALILVMIGRFWPAGPSYESRSIREWFRADVERKPVDRDKEVEAFRAMGPEAVRFLISRLEDAPSDRVSGLLEKLGPQAYRAYRQRKSMWQNRAAYLLGELGPAASAAEPHLTVALRSDDWALRGSAKVALMKIRQEPLEPMIERLKETGDWQTWYANAMMVGQFGGRAEAAIPILLNSLQHSNAIIQAHALIALGMIARQPEVCVPAITPFLKSPLPGDRQKAMSALLMFGKDAAQAQAEIERALLDVDPWVRHQARMSIDILQQKSQSP